ncbi:MAG TPA: hydroxyacylglutathione hydrolase [Hydrogenophaga sp.]|uniref:hydroxyacylglutathione hydrolase n=1 Tax=Hydrogenophaga sp. TaxID=1904254 RepID=UPI002C6F4658|nr:hydroxyacylglutathione hydrolase [Hydrogenophaga sp.]HMN92376.1 hydroxyacylglutathione hydrolase [Hydrogenophaga sp.]HMP10602.1 hydroxyacylglutathione hydrolase [Hydrogenophaga sp.]
MVLHPLPAFADNYIWCVHDGREALVVDPGEADGVLAWLASEQVSLRTILITHHHPDHTAGVAALREATGAEVYGPRLEALPEPVLRVSEGDRVQALGLAFDVIDVPGHTAGHIAYFAPETGTNPWLFCGDTLFSGGCGRLFEGTPAQMLSSLQQLAALPETTRVCCTHEYTLANLLFAVAVDPDNPDLHDHLKRCRQWRSQNFPTLPSSIGLEKRINPFLRSRDPAIVKSVCGHAGQQLTDPVDVFAALREWKNVFR